VSRRYACRDGYCGAEDCEQCRPGCTRALALLAEEEAGFPPARLLSVGDIVRDGTDAVVLAVAGGLVHLSGEDGDTTATAWFTLSELAAIEADFAAMVSP